MARGFFRSLALAALTAVLLAVPATAAARPPAGQGPVRMNELQVIGTHNSYKRELSRAEEAEYDKLVKRPGDYQEFLAYSHTSIAKQLARQGVRALELDLFGDPKGGLYAEPLIRRRLGLGPLPERAWRRPGIKVLHIADLDYRTTCVLLVQCLRQVKRWSDAHPRHVPVMIQLELKGSDRRVVEQGGVVAPPWELAALEALDAEIRSVFSERDMITPDDVRRPGLTLEQSVRRFGWPALRRARGQVAFLFDNDPGPSSTAYTAGHPNLEGRAVFTNSRPGRPDAAFIKRNEPRNENTAAIQQLVREGYLVRTRSDLPLQTVKSGDTTMLKAALRSGAQIVSTDFPEAGMSARYGSDYVARLPNGRPARCNPVNARANCRSNRLERLGGGRGPRNDGRNAGRR